MICIGRTRKHIVFSSYIFSSNGFTIIWSQNVNSSSEVVGLGHLVQYKKKKQKYQRKGWNKAMKTRIMRLNKK